MARREVHAEVIGYYHPVDKAFIIHIDDMSKEKWYGRTNKIMEGSVSAIYSQAMIWLKPIGPHKTLIKIILNANP